MLIGIFMLLCTVCSLFSGILVFHIRNEKRYTIFHVIICVVGFIGTFISLFLIFVGFAFNKMSNFIMTKNISKKIHNFIFKERFIGKK